MPMPQARSQPQIEEAPPARPVPPALGAGQLADLLAELLAARQTVLPRRLGAPGPDAAQLHAILQAAGHAPDHGRLLPWRFIVVPGPARAALGDAFVQALLERDPAADAAEQAQAHAKALRAPALALLVVSEALDAASADIPAAERILSAGCAVQNVLLMATALGHGSALTSGRALQSRALRALFRLHPHERALCFVSFGTVLARKPARTRPLAQQYVSTLAVGHCATPPQPLF